MRTMIERPRAGGPPASMPALYAILLTSLALIFLVSLMAGKVWVPLEAIGTADDRWWIVMELRLPRSILAVMIGAILGLAGAVLQGYLRNPLADPSIIGVSASAAFGAVAAIYFGLGASLWIVSGSAMLAAGGSVAMLALLVGRSGSATGFILAGTVLSTLAGAMTTLLISLAPNPFATSEIVTWLLGALTDRGYPELTIAAPFLIAGAGLLLTTGRALDALTLGEDVARSLGTNLTALQAIIAAGLGLAIGASVAVTGIVGFVGLIVPHLLRPFVGQRPSALLPPSMVGGAVLLLAADTAVRLTPGAAEVKLGVAMALIGAPFFFWLLWRYRRGMP